MHSPVEIVFGLVLAVLAVVVYFAPAIIADRNNHPHKDAITLVNLVIGWTLIGWVVAAAWASTKKAEDQK